MSTTSNEIQLKGLMTRDEVGAAIREFVLKQFPAARNRGVAADDSLLVQGIVDSLGVLEVVTFIETEFQLTITDDELLSDHFESIASMADFVAQKIAGEESTWTS